MLAKNIYRLTGTNSIVLVSETAKSGQVESSIVEFKTHNKLKKRLAEKILVKQMYATCLAPDSKQARNKGNYLVKKGAAYN